MRMTGPEITRRRHAVGLTQEQLARLAGCSNYMIWNVEHERRRMSERLAARIDAVLSGAELGRQEMERRLAAVG